MNVLVLGGAGDMGSRAVRDLVGQPETESVVIADYNEVAAKLLADSLGSGKAVPIRVDANDHDALVAAMRGHDVVASGLGPFYRFETKCASAAIEAGCHYVSLCDDYDAAQAVLELHDEALDRGVTVLTGLGWTPGMSNVLARKAADQMDEVEEINVSWGSSASDSEGYAVILHTLHIFSGLVPSYQDGELLRVPAGTGKQRVRFPEPLGEVNVFHLGHPEPVTLPRCFTSVRTVTLKGGLAENALNSLAILLNKLRLINTPGKRDALAKMLKVLLPALSKIGKPANPCSGVRVDVKGKQDGQPTEISYGAADHMDNLTGLPMAIGAIMLGRGDIRERGVIAPEQCIDPDAFIAELARRDVRVYRGPELDTLVS
jgi:lysine 6-dehydrogenase